MKQIMMKGKQRVKGTVLFTVVTVMMVMVVFLMSTLILTTSANRRSYYTYYQTQAQYAAQSALDCITNFAYSDGDFSDWVQGFADDDYSEHEIYINYSDSKMPLSDVNAPNKSIRCTIRREKNANHVYDNITQKIHEQPQWKITATAVIGTGRNRTQAQKATYLYANVQVPKLSDVKNEINYTQYLYDEVVTEEETEEYIIDPDAPFTPVANAVYSLSPTGTDDNVVVLGPQYSGMTRIPKGRTKYGDRNGSFQAIKNDLGGVSDGVFNGNAKITVKNGYVFQRPGEGMQYFGNLMFNNAGDYFTARLKATDTTKYSYQQQNYLYVDGMIYNDGGKLSIGYDKASPNDNGNTAADKSSRPVNLFAGGVMFDKVNGGANVCGDVYLYDTDLSSQWTAFQGATILATFVAKNVTNSNAETAKFSGTHGNLVCNNKSLTLGGGSGTLTIQGDLLFTNPKGSVTISTPVHVNGKAIFACSNVTGADKLTADGGIVYGNSANYATALETVMKTSYASGAYGKNASGEITLAKYRSDAGANDFSLLPFNYRLDEIFATYYRWDLANNTGWATDPLVVESKACGHTWKTKSFTATVFDHSEAVNEHGLTITDLSAYGVTDPYNDSRVTQEGYDQGKQTNVFGFNGNKDVYKQATVTVPYTTPVNTANIIIKEPFEPINYNNAAAEVSDRSNLSYKNISGFKADMKQGAPTITTANKAQYGFTGNISWAYPDGATVKTTTDNVYYVNFDCEIDMAAIPAGEILFIDPSQSATTPLRVAIKGSLKNRVVLINNTAKYKGGAANPAIDFTYGSAEAVDKDGKAIYFGREDVFLFLESGVDLEKALILTTGTAGGYSGEPNIESKYTIDIVSNPYYPGTTKWNALTGAEKWKFMYVPNDIIFGEEDATYFFKNGGMVTGVVMMPYSTLKHATQTQKLDIHFRMDHESQPVDTAGLTQSGNAPVIVSIGSQVVGKFIGENVSTVAYIGDGNRKGSTVKRTTTTTETQNTNNKNQDIKDDPAFNSGQDNFSNDHQGPN